MNLSIGHLAFFLLFFVSLFLPSQVFATVRCESQYGGGETCVRTGQLQINKKVFDPDSATYVDNLGLTSHRFVSGNEITFSLRVTNTGDARIENIVVTDTLPSFLIPLSGDFSYTISGLNAGASDERLIKAKVVDSSKLPVSKTIVCDVNSVEAHSGDYSDRDSAQVCVENKVLGTKQLPATGPTVWLLFLIVPITIFLGRKLITVK